MGARRVSRPGGGTVYEIGDDGPLGGGAARAGLATSVSANRSLVVVRTHPGSAPAVARAIDLARIGGVLGTIAGDDTVFVAPSRERGAAALAARLGELLGVRAARAAAARGAPRG
jgi:transcriptional regulator of arginine metabolism